MTDQREVPIYVPMDGEAWPTDLRAALTLWRDAAGLADTLQLTAKAEKAAAYLAPDLPFLKFTDAMRDAYATVQANETAQRAAKAAIEAKALGYWLRYVLERELQMVLPADTEAPAATEQPRPVPTGWWIQSPTGKRVDGPFADHANAFAALLVLCEELPSGEFSIAHVAEENRQPGLGEVCEK